MKSVALLAIPAITWKLTQKPKEILTSRSVKKRLTKRKIGYAFACRMDVLEFCRMDNGGEIVEVNWT